MKKARLIYNPAAGSRPGSGGVKALLSILRLEGRYEIEAVATEAAGHATLLAEEAVGDGIHTVFAWGGDGTLRETAKGLLGTDVPLGMLPGGTANVLSHFLGLGRNPRRAARLLCEGTVRPIDVGFCGEEPFLMMVSLGLDARTLANLDLTKKKRWGRLAIVAQGLQEWAKFPGPEVEIYSDSGTTKSHFTALCNIPFYGGPFALAPRASVHDGQLDLVAFQGRSRSSLLSFFLDVATSSHLDRRDVVYTQSSSFSLRGEGEERVQIDGDPTDLKLPLEISTKRDHLRIVFP